MRRLYRRNAVVGTPNSPRGKILFTGSILGEFQIRTGFDWGVVTGTPRVQKRKDSGRRKGRVHGELGRVRILRGNGSGVVGAAGTIPGGLEFTKIIFRDGAGWWDVFPPIFEVKVLLAFEADIGESLKGLGYLLYPRF